MLLTSRSPFLKEAEELAREALGDPLVSEVARYYAEVTLGYLAIIRRDPEGARAAYEALASRAEVPNPEWRMNLGLLARAAGRTEDSVRYLRDAVEKSRAGHGGEGPSTYWMRYHLAETLVERSGPGDRTEARRLLEEVVALARRTGSVLAQGKARQLLERLAAEPEEPAAETRRPWPHDLTDREIDVLRLVVQGKTNREIGIELYVSPKTVETHVRNILHKIGATNRVEIASYAIRNKLVEP